MAKDAEEGYELSLLFLVFLGINLAWEALVGCLSHITEIWGHNTRRVLLERLKEELLDLGIISLVLAFIEPPLSSICVASGGLGTGGSKSDDEQARDRVSRECKELGMHCEEPLCPAGERQLFTSKSIKSGHYLLFFFAVVTILYTYVSVMFTMARFKYLARLETRTRTNAAAAATAAAAAAAAESRTGGGGIAQEAMGGIARSLGRLSTGIARMSAGNLGRPSAGLGRPSLGLGRSSMRANGPDMASGPPATIPEGSLAREPGGHAFTIPEGGHLDIEAHHMGQGQPGLGGKLTAMHQLGSGLAGCASGCQKWCLRPIGYSIKMLVLVLVGQVDEPTFAALRNLALLRVQLHGQQAQLRNLNYANASEQMVQRELGLASAHTWLQTICVALLVLYPQRGFQLVWVTGVSGFLLVILALKLNTSVRDIRDLMLAAQHSEEHLGKKLQRSSLPPPHFMAYQKEEQTSEDVPPIMDQSQPRPSPSRSARSSKQHKSMRSSAAGVQQGPDAASGVLAEQGVGSRDDVGPPADGDAESALDQGGGGLLSAQRLQGSGSASGRASRQGGESGWGSRPEGGPQGGRPVDPSGVQLALRGVEGNRQPPTGGITLARRSQDGQVHASSTNGGMQTGERRRSAPGSREAPSGAPTEGDSMLSPHPLPPLPPPPASPPPPQPSPPQPYLPTQPRPSQPSSMHPHLLSSLPAFSPAAPDPPPTPWRLPGVWHVLSPPEPPHPSPPPAQQLPHTGLTLESNMSTSSPLPHAASQATVAPPNLDNSQEPVPLAATGNDEKAGSSRNSSDSSRHSAETDSQHIASKSRESEHHHHNQEQQQLSSSRHSSCSGSDPPRQFRQPLNQQGSFACSASGDQGGETGEESEQAQWGPAWVEGAKHRQRRRRWSSSGAATVPDVNTHAGRSTRNQGMPAGTIQSTASVDCHPAQLKEPKGFEGSHAAAPDPIGPAPGAVLASHTLAIAPTNDPHKGEAERDRACHHTQHHHHQPGHQQRGSLDHQEECGDASAPSPPVQQNHQQQHNHQHCHHRNCQRGCVVVSIPSRAGSISLQGSSSGSPQFSGTTPRAHHIFMPPSREASIQLQGSSSGSPHHGGTTPSPRADHILVPPSREGSLSPQDVNSGSPLLSGATPPPQAHQISMAPSQKGSTSPQGSSSSSGPPLQGHGSPARGQSSTPTKPSCALYSAEGSAGACESDDSHQAAEAHKNKASQRAGGSSSSSTEGAKSERQGQSSNGRGQGGDSSAGRTSTVEWLSGQRQGQSSDGRGQGIESSAGSKVAQPGTRPHRHKWPLPVSRFASAVGEGRAAVGEEGGGGGDKLAGKVAKNAKEFAEKIAHGFKGHKGRGTQEGKGRGKGGNDGSEAGPEEEDSASASSDEEELEGASDGSTSRAAEFTGQAPDLDALPLWHTLGVGVTNHVLTMGEAQAVAALEIKARRLFWFNWPQLLLWLTLLAIVINATSITLFVDLLINYEGNPTAEATLIYWPNLTALWAPLLVVDCFLALYLGWVIVPQYALLNITVQMHPSTLYHHLRWSKVAKHEEEHGIAGLVAHLLHAMHHGWELRRRGWWRSVRATRQSMVTSPCECAPCMPLARMLMLPPSSTGPPEEQGAPSAQRPPQPQASASPLMRHSVQLKPALPTQAGVGGPMFTANPMFSTGAGPGASLYRPSRPLATTSLGGASLAAQSIGWGTAGGGVQVPAPVHVPCAFPSPTNPAQQPTVQPPIVPAPSLSASHALTTAGTPPLGTVSVPRTPRTALNTASLPSLQRSSRKAGPGTYFELPPGPLVTAAPQLPSTLSPLPPIGRTSRPRVPALQGARTSRQVAATVEAVAAKAAGVEERALADAFVSGLAHRAGVLTAHDPEGTASQATLSQYVTLFAGYASVWMHKMRVAKGEEEAPEHGYQLNDEAGVIQPFRSAFAVLDLDRSGYLGAWELREHLRSSLGTKVTPQELRAMLVEMGADTKYQQQQPMQATPAGLVPQAQTEVEEEQGSQQQQQQQQQQASGPRRVRRIDFKAFVSFCAFAFFDRLSTGSISVQELQVAMHDVGLEVTPQVVMDMISIIDEEGDFRARPTGWMRLFDDLEFYSGDFHSEQFHSGEV